MEERAMLLELHCRRTAELRTSNFWCWSNNAFGSVQFSSTLFDRCHTEANSYVADAYMETEKAEGIKAFPHPALALQAK